MCIIVFYCLCGEKLWKVKSYDMFHSSPESPIKLDLDYNAAVTEQKTSKGSVT